jgi:Uma2 family endonuclease
MASPAHTGFTYADLERLPADDGVKHELIDGELFMSPKAVLRHQYVATRIARVLLDYADEHGGAAYAEPGAYFSDVTYLIPDVVLVTATTRKGLDTRHIDTTPDLIVEVSSPATRRLDLIRKRDLYERQGVPEYWFVDLDADRVEAYRLTDGHYPAPIVVERDGVVEPPHLPGLAVSVDNVLGQPETTG